MSRKSDTGSELLEKEDLEEPPLYRVILHNDDYTPMEFVVSVLIDIFSKSEQEATKIMLSVHEKGIGVCGVYAFEVAETKVAQVEHLAKRQGWPLKCTMEPE